MHTGDLLTRAMAIAGINGHELAQELHVTDTAVYGTLKRANSTPALLEAYAGAMTAIMERRGLPLGYTLDSLLSPGGPELIALNPPRELDIPPVDGVEPIASRFVRVPVYDGAQCGAAMGDDWGSVMYEIAVRSNDLRSGVRTDELAACIARGDSMEGAGIEEGDLLIFDRGQPVEPGCVVLVRRNGGPLECKLVADDGRTLFSQPRGGEVALVLTPLDEVILIGVVVCHQRSLMPRQRRR